MSSAIRSAQNRRVNVPQSQAVTQQIPQYQPSPVIQRGAVSFAQNPEQLLPPPQQQQQQQQQNIPRGANLTAQQTFDIVFSRILNLEKAVSEKSPDKELDNIQPILDEFNSRTEILAGEIADIKDMLLKLQTYTLEVNQKLFLQQMNQYQPTDEIQEDA